MDITIKLPPEIGLILARLDNIERLLVDKPDTPFQKTDEILTVTQVAEFYSLSIPTIYALNAQGKLPSMKRGKRVYFFKADLIKYLKEGKKKSTSDIEAEADAFLARKRKGGRNV